MSPIFLQQPTGKILYPNSWTLEMAQYASMIGVRLLSFTSTTILFSGREYFEFPSEVEDSSRFTLKYRQKKKQDEHYGRCHKQPDLRKFKESEACSTTFGLLQDYDVACSP